MRLGCYHVLMLDARNIYRKVTRAIFDFSLEQQKNIAAIVWLYRGQSERFLGLVEDYIAQSLVEGQATAEPLSMFKEALGDLIGLAEPFASESRDPDPLATTWEELTSTRATLAADIKGFATDMAARVAEWDRMGNGTTRENAALHAAREGLHDMAERCQDLTKEIDLAAKLAGRAVDIAVRELVARESALWANADINRTCRTLEVARAAGVEALRRARYFVRQADWLQERFPDAELRDVEGLVKLVNHAQIEEHDWSLTPGRYVGVAPEEEDENFHFEEELRSIHMDLEAFNEEAAELTKRIFRNLKELGL